MSWKGVITNAGNALLAQWAGGSETLYITGATAGSSYVPDINMRAATALQSYEADASIVKNVDLGNNSRKLSIRIGPAASTAYTLHEIGIWGKLGASGTETLISLHQDSDTGVDVPTESTASEFIFTLNAIISFSNNGSLSVTIDTTVCATVDDLDDLADDVANTYAPKADPVLTGSISLGRKSGTTVGTDSFAVGNNAEASNDYAHAEGKNTKASGKQSHAEGSGSTASGQNSHSEGSSNTASGANSHAEGYSNTASGNYSHAEGHSTEASAKISHAEGNGTVAATGTSHVSGMYNVADTLDNVPAWASGTAYSVGDRVKFTPVSTTYTYVCITAHTSSSANAPESDGGTYWKCDVGSPRGEFAEIVGNGYDDSHRSNARTLDWDGNERLHGTLRVGCNDDSSGGKEVATRTDTVLDTYLSRGRIGGTNNIGEGSFAFGKNVYASGDYSHAEGKGTYARGENSHAEGENTEANGVDSHSEGRAAYAIADWTHAEGSHTKAIGYYSHAEGFNTIIASDAGHVSGQYNCKEYPDWVAGTSYTYGDCVIYSNKKYKCNTSNSDATFTPSHWDSYGVPDVAAEIVGCGTSNNNRKNARLLDWSGNEHLKGDVYVNCNDDSSGGTAVGQALGKILPVISGTTNNSGYAISSGEYFEANGNLYKATAAIALNAAWSSSASLQSDHGVVNALNSNLTSRLTLSDNSNITPSTNITMSSGSLRKTATFGNLAIIAITFDATSDVGINSTIISGLPASYNNRSIIWGFDNNSQTTPIGFNIDNAGVMKNDTALTSGHSYRIYAVYPCA